MGAILLENNRQSTCMSEGYKLLLCQNILLLKTDEIEGRVCVCLLNRLRSSVSGSMCSLDWRWRCESSSIPAYFEGISRQTTSLRWWLTLEVEQGERASGKDKSAGSVRSVQIRGGRYR